MSELIKTSLGKFVATGLGFETQGQAGSHTATVSVVGTGSVAAAVTIRGSNDRVVWNPIGTVSPSGTGAASGTVAWTQDYAYLQAECASITGVGAVVHVDVVTDQAGGEVGIPPQPDLPTLIAAYPAASNAGKTALVGDVMYYSNGTDWVEVGGGATNYVDLADPKYGLDWNAADNKAAIIAALNDAVANGGDGVLFVPPSPSNGMVIKTDGIDMAAYRRVTIYGVGRGSFLNGDEITRGLSTIQLKDNATAHLFTLRSNANSALRSDNVQFIGLNLIGNKTNQGANIWHGVYVEGETSALTARNVVERCYIHNFSGDAIYLDSVSGASKTSMKVHDNCLFDCRSGVESRASDVWITENDIGRMTSNGISIHNWTNHVIGNNVFDCQVGIYTWVGEAGLCSIENNFVDRNRSSGMVLGGRAITASGNCFHANSRGGTAGGATDVAANNVNPHITVASSGVTIVANTFRRPAGAQNDGGSTTYWNLASYDVYLNATDPSNGNAPVVATVTGNYTDGRGNTSLYGHIGIPTGSGCRVITGAGAVERQMATNVLLAVTTASGATLANRATLHEVIYRTGPTANFTDTTATAALIAGTMVDCAVGGDGLGSFSFRYVNATAFTATLAGGTGVTISGTATIAANSYRDFVHKQTGSSAATITNVGGGSL